MPKVSIIVPIYNVSKYLSNCIESIIAQSYKDYECILVDDGSTDGSSEICDLFANKDKRITVIHKKNEGLSSARNAGLEVANGKYYVFVDSDDKIEPDMLNDCITSMEKSQSDLIVFNFQKIKDDGEVIWKSNCGTGTYSITNEEYRFDFVLHFLFDNKIYWPVWNKIYSADIIKKYRLRFENNKKIFSEDGCFNMYYMLHISKMNIIEGVYYDYLQRPGSLMEGNSSDIKLRQFVALSEKYYEYLNKVGFDFFKRHYYILFYKIMNKQYIKGNILQIANRISEIDNIRFFRKYTFKMMVYGMRNKKILDDTISYFYLLYFSLLLASSKVKICNIAWKLLRDYLKKYKMR